MGQNSFYPLIDELSRKRVCIGTVQNKKFIKGISQKTEGFARRYFERRLLALEFDALNV